MALLAVGSIALDTVETPFGRREDVLGGSATYFSTAASLFGPVRLVATIGDDFPEEHARFLASRGVDLAGLERRAGQTFRWKGRYEHDLNQAHTLETRLNVFADWRPRLPEPYLDSDFVFLGNIDPDLQREVLAAVHAPRFVALDTMNYWIEGKRESLLQTLRRIDLLFVNDAEARQLAGEPNVVKAARAILRMGPREVVVKRGEYGALLFSGDRVFSSPAWPLAALADPTGAGDSFAGGFMGYLARASRADAPTLKKAMVVGTVVASFAVEDFSLERLRTLTFDEVCARYRAVGELTRFEELELEGPGAA